MMITAFALAIAAPAPFARHDENSLIAFEYGWPAEASAVPALARRFRADMDEQWRRAVATADENRRLAKQGGFEFHQHMFSRSWHTAGRSARLLSLQSESYSFTGGAHGLGGTGALLWDLALGRATGIAQLMTPGASWDGAIRQPFCTLLDRERRKRRGGPVSRSDPFGDCPRLKEVTVVLADRDRDRRFDHLAVTADPYVAGPYVEGPYEISLPITARMIARLKPVHRASFEAQPPVQ